ncbi:hypothetical protein Tco_1025527 [Tanacetum coccineum]
MSTVECPIAVCETEDEDSITTLDDQKLSIFNVGDQVLLFNFHLKIFSGKLKTRWSGPFTITKVFPYGTIELSQPDGPNFKVNGHRVKHYFGGDLPSQGKSKIASKLLQETNEFGESSKSYSDSITKTKRFMGDTPFLSFYLLSYFYCDVERLCISSDSCMIVLS